MKTILKYYDDLNESKALNWWNQFDDINKHILWNIPGMLFLLETSNTEVRGIVECFYFYTIYKLHTSSIISTTIRTNIGHSDRDTEKHDAKVNKFLQDNEINKKEKLIKISATPYPDVLFTTIIFQNSLLERLIWKSQE